MRSTPNLSSMDCSSFAAPPAALWTRLVLQAALPATAAGPPDRRAAALLGDRCAGAHHGRPLVLRQLTDSRPQDVIAELRVGPLRPAGQRIHQVRHAQATDTPVPSASRRAAAPAARPPGRRQQFGLNTTSPSNLSGSGSAGSRGAVDLDVWQVIRPQVEARGERADDARGEPQDRDGMGRDGHRRPSRPAGRGR